MFIIDVETPGKNELLGVVHAHDPLPFLFRLGEGWQEHAGEDGDDGDDDEEFDEGESATEANGVGMRVYSHKANVVAVW